MAPHAVGVGYDTAKVSKMEKNSNVLLRQYELSWLESIAARILKHGRIPRHLAVIMDGNRRYAKLYKKEAIEGHRQGFQKLSEVLFWCRQLGIPEVTVYAFSIENFKRKQDEVSALMDLAESKFREILKDRQRLEDEGVRIRVLGNTTYLPVSLQQVCADLTLATKHHSKCFLNIALSYTSREEMCTAIENLVAGANEGVVKARHFSEALLSSAMYSRDSPDPDLLVRTSGEVRLSDFLLWQTGFTVVEFIPSLWPELTAWQFFAAILQYQWQARRVGRCVGFGYSERNGRSLPAEDCGGANDGPKTSELEFEDFLEQRRTQQLREASLGNTVQRIWADDAVV
ncbi:dehydrodolichyl diphosphate synthase-like [Tropilaelaps mercedesae]|uniref:Alkyl transferase n=1 Tax=Tropilaelaps mercedesae TaxID=418985 RepID=A0A1V9XJ09_9ACAR|nr:dehydrodolichyl diphosphate synthase-like [Tropilaelaps mercedesae]